MADVRLSIKDTTSLEQATEQVWRAWLMAAAEHLCKALETNGDVIVGARMRCQPPKVGSQGPVVTVEGVSEDTLVEIRLYVVEGVPRAGGELTIGVDSRNVKALGSPWMKVWEFSADVCDSLRSTAESLKI